MTDPINMEAVAWRIQMLDDTWEATTSLEAAQSYIDNGYVVEALGPTPAVSRDDVFQEINGWIRDEKSFALAAGMVPAARDRLATRIIERFKGKA